MSRWRSSVGGFVATGISVLSAIFARAEENTYGGGDIIDLSAYQERGGIVDISARKTTRYQRAAVRSATNAPRTVPGAGFIDLGSAPTGPDGVVIAGTDNAADNSDALRKVLYFSTLEASRDSGYASIGHRFMPFADNAGSGVIMSMSVGSGWYRYLKSAKTKQWVKATVGGVAAGIGYRFERPKFGVTALVGPALEYQLLSSPDPGNRGDGLRFAARGAVDGWGKPLKNVLVAGHTSLSTFDTRWYGRMFSGYEFFPKLFVGAEAATMGDRQYQEWRVGAAAIGIPAGKLRANLSTGVRFRPDKSPGIYVSGALWRRF